MLKKFWSEDLKRRDYLGDLGIDGRWAVRKYDLRVQNRVQL
jgi:hypothetical protein